MASHQIQKILSPLPRGAQTIETAKYSVFTAGIRYKAVYDMPSIKVNFFMLCRFVSPAAVPFTLVVL